MQVDPYVAAAGLLVLALVLLSVPVWGALDAALHPEPAWAGAPVGRRMAVGVQLVGAPLGLGVQLMVAAYTRVWVRCLSLS